MDVRQKEYNLRGQPGKKANNTGSKRRETGQKNLGIASHDTHDVTLPQGATAGANFADTSRTSSTSTVHDVNGPPTPNAVPTELMAFMSDIRDMFTSFTSQVNTKLDTVVNEITNLKTEMEATKKVISDIETSLTSTSDRLLAIEKDDLPQLRNNIDKKIEEINEKLTLGEIHDRKLNLLVYGMAPPTDENIYDTVHQTICFFMNISKQEAMQIPLVNAHRLPSTPRGDRNSNRQPPAIIIRFGRMMDRDRLLQAYERRPRRQPDPSGSRASDPPSPFSRVSIRTDLPPSMKRERGRLAAIAYNIRKNNNLATRIKVTGTKILLQTRKPVRNGDTPDRWANWSE